MPRFAANLSMLYPELDFLDRFEAAAKDGFAAVEYLFPYAYERARAEGASLGQRPAAGALQRARRATGQRRPRPGLRAGPRSRVPRWHPEGARLRGGARLPARPRHGRPGARGHGARGRAAALHRESALGRARSGEGRARPADRADQHARHPALLPEPAGPCARACRGDRRAQPQGADGPLPLPDRRGRRRDEDPQVPAHRSRRPLPDRGRARAARARRRRAEPSLPVRRHRRGVGAMRLAGWVGCEYRPRRGAIANGTSDGLGWLRALPRTSGA